MATGPYCNPVERSLAAKSRQGRIAVAVSPAAAQAARVARRFGWRVMGASDLERAADLISAAGNAGVRSALIIAPLGSFPPDAFVRLAGRMCQEAPSIAAGFAYG